MLRRVGNRAYRRLNEVLNLDGSRVVSEVDLAQAIPTHDLTPIVQSGIGESVRWYRQATVGAGTTYVNVSPWLPGQFLHVMTSERNTVPDSTVESWESPDFDILLDFMGVHVSDTTQITWTGFGIDLRGVAGAPRIPVTSQLDTNTYGRGLGPSSGEPYYLQRMPLWLPQQLYLLTFGYETTGAVTLRTTIQGRVYPAGVLEHAS